MAIMTDMELDIRIKLLIEESYKDYTRKRLDVPDRLCEKTLTLCRLRWARVPVQYRRWCDTAANGNNKTMKQWRVDNNAGSVAV